VNESICRRARSLLRPFVFLALISLLGGLKLALAQTGGKLPDFYKEPGMQPNRDYVNQHFGEHIDPFTGALQLHYTDIHIPGNGGFDLNVSRSYNSASVDRANPKHHSMMGVGWSLHMGRVSKTGIDICSNTDPDSGNDNPVLETPDGGTQRLYFTSSGSPLMITQRRWKAECISGANPGLLISAPNGTQYRMNRQYAEGTFENPVYTYYTTLITDRNGNTMTVNYNTAALAKAEITSIVRNTSSDTATVTFTYAGAGTSSRRVTSIAGPSGTWGYGYTEISGKPGVYQLTSVDRPVSGDWSYRYNNFGILDTAGNHMMDGLTMPQGGTISYDYTNVSVDNAAGGVNAPSMVTSKSGGGSWSWTYNPASNVGSYDSTTVSTPSGTHTYQHWGANSVSNGDVWRIGLLRTKSLGSVQTETYEWDKVFVSGEPNNREGLFASKGDTDTYQAVLSKKTISRGGSSFVTDYGSWDVYGNPTSISESGVNGGSRSTTVSYFNSTSKWIIGFVDDESRTGGQNVTRSYDSDGNLTGICRDSVCNGYGYDASGNVTRMTNPRGIDTTYGSYYRGTPQSETRPAGVSVSRNVNSAGNITSETIGGQQFSYGYDDINRVTSIGYPVGSDVSISYGSSSKTATRGTLTESTSYNGYGYVTGVTLGGISTSYSVDPLGRRTFESNPGSTSGTSFRYDILDRITGMTLPGGATRSMSHGGASTTVTDERDFATTYSYRSYGDPNVRHLIGINAPQQDTTIGRNSRDLISSVAQGSFTRTYGYNTQYYLTSIVDPETGTTEYGRDGNGNMTSRKVGGSGSTTYTYDGLDRQTGVAYPGGPTITKTYNGRGKLLSVTGGQGSRGYSYDANDNLSSETLTIDGRTFTANYGYTSLDHLASITYPKTGRVVSYAPNALGRPTQVSGFATSLSYFDSGQLYRITYNGGGTATYEQNARLWPTGFVAVKGSTHIDSAYAYDDTGNITAINDSVDNSFDRTLGYDGIGRLTSAAGPWGAGSFTYDGVGNITQKVLGGQTTSYSYNSTSNLLASLSGARVASFTYGDYASISSDGANTYTYNGVPNLTCVNCADPVKKIEYRYDGTNMRTAKEQNDVTTYEFHNARGQLLLEYTPTSNDRTVEHIYLGDKRIAQETNDTTTEKTSTTTSLSTSASSTSCGSTLTLTATVSPSAATGTVQFLDGGALIATATLNSGNATLVIALQRAGTRSITARYVGNATYEESTSTARSITVSSASNSIALSYSPNPPFVPNQPLSIIATVAGCLQGDGQIEFKTGSGGAVASIPTATIPLNNTRSATRTFSPNFSSNSYQFRATLMGDSVGTNLIYADGSFTVRNTPALTASANPPNVTLGASTVITADVAGVAGIALPKGNITFKQGSSTLGVRYFDGTTPVTLNYTPPSSPGNYFVIVEYGGDSFYNAVTNTVAISNLPATTTLLEASNNPIAIDTPITFTASVSSLSGTPMGTVTFYKQGDVLGTAVLNAARIATLTVSTLPLGTYEIRAVYEGSTTLAPSSATLTLAVTKRQRTLTLLISENPASAFSEVGFRPILSESLPYPNNYELALVRYNDIPMLVLVTNTGEALRKQVPPGTWSVTAMIPENDIYAETVSPPVNFTVNQSSLCNVTFRGGSVFESRDGMAILRALLGFRVAPYTLPITLEAISPRGRLYDQGNEVMALAQAQNLTFDIDGDGTVNAMTDGIILLRVSLGLTGDAVTANAVNPAGSRTSWASIRDHLNTTCGLSLPQ
jgi:YD repeat-containing protein